jgi:transcriptional regulator with XRE-family HTH domain
MSPEDAKKAKAIATILTPFVAGKNMTQIANEIGIGDASFRKYVKGETLPSAGALKAIADHFKIPITEFNKPQKTEDKLENIKNQINALDLTERRDLMSWLVNSL